MGGMALLLLMLVPMMFLPDMLDADSDTDADTQDIPNDDTKSDDLLVEDGPGSDLIEPDNTEPPKFIDILQPDYGNDLPGDETQVVDPETVLAPIDEDDESSPWDEDDDEEDDEDEDGDGDDDEDKDEDEDKEDEKALLPIDEIESDADDIWLDLEGDDGLGYVEIEDFVVGEDIIHISIPPDSVTGKLDVDVQASDDGQDGLVYIEQQLVVILKGAPDAGADDVFVQVSTIAA